MKNFPFKKVIIIHPGTQYAYRLANALTEIYHSEITLFTWFILPKKHYLSSLSFFRKRVKEISRKTRVHNFPLFEILFNIHLKLYRLLNINGNNPYYVWQTIFGWFLLPILYFNRKSSILVTFETCGWPLVKYAKKWNIPVIMDFPSISHEMAENLGIQETAYGKKIKTLERQQIDYAISCSNFAKESYKNLTSAKIHFSIWLGTDFKNDSEYLYIPNQSTLNICCLANTEQRKGIDILLEAFNKIDKADKKLYLIGNINPNWVNNYCTENNLSLANIILTGPKAQQDLKEYLLKEKISLHILASRFDSFGMVVAETMALGIPNILSPYVGAGEMIETGKDGFVMKNLKSTELANYINEYLNMSNEEKAEFSNLAQKKSKEMTWENYSQRIEFAFDKIIATL